MDLSGTTALPDEKQPNNLTRQNVLLVSLPYLLFVILGILGGMMLAHSQDYGPWVYSDSVEYILSAKNFVKGLGFGIQSPTGGFMPLTLHPPLYPLLMVPFLLVGIEALTAATILNIFFFSACIFLVGAGTYFLTRSLGWSFSVSLLTLVSPALVRNFDGAMSEPPFIFFTIANIFLLALYLRRPRTWLWVAAALMAAAAILTRFVGVVSILIGLLALLLLDSRPVRFRLKSAFGYAVLGSLPSAFWLLGGMLRTGQVAARTFQINPGLLTAANEFRKATMEILILWLPYQHRLDTWRMKALVLFGLIGLSVALILLAWWLFRRSRSPVDAANQRSALIWLGLAGFYAAGYLQFIAVSYMFSSIQPDINERTLLLLQPMLFLLLTGSLFTFFRAIRAHLAWQVLPLVALALCVNAYWPVTRNYVDKRNDTGSGYTSRTWRSSALMPVVATLPSDLPLISNQGAAVLFYTSRFPYELRIPVEGDEPGEYTRFGEGSTFLEEIFQRDCAALILFIGELTYQFEPFYYSRTAERISALTEDLQVYWESPEGGIYFQPGCPLPD